MRSPFLSFAGFVISAVLSLLVIVTILLGYRFLSAEYAKYESLEREQSTLRQFKRELESIRDKLAKELPSRIPTLGTPANLLAERIKALESEISNSQLARQILRDTHPIDRFLPGSDSFRQLAALDIEIAFLQQVLAHVRKLYTITAGPVEAERQIQSLQAGSRQLAEQIYLNQKAQWMLSKQEPLMWQVPYTSAYRQMKRWEEEVRSLQITKNQHGAEILRQQRLLEGFQKLPRLGPLRLDYESANRAIDPLSERLIENDKQLEGSSQHKFVRPIKDVLPTALWILLFALLSPLLLKSIAYYLIAPIAVRRRPIRLLPDSSGKISASLASPGSEPGQALPSRVSLALAVDEHSALLILPSYLQGMPLNVESDTQWLLDWSMPLTSLLAGMYRLTRLRPNSEQRITVSSSNDPLAEFALLDLPEGAALVLQPGCLVGIILAHDEPLTITRHWRFNRLGAWLTLQFRYIVFHGPVKLIVKGCRGVRVESAIGGRRVNQAATLGFSANLDYSVARNETFWSYLFGERDLFNDSWQGNGYCIHAETPNPNDRSGLFGRGLQGAVDTLLRSFGI